MVPIISYGGRCRLQRVDADCGVSCIHSRRVGRSTSSFPDKGGGGLSGVAEKAFPALFTLDASPNDAAMAKKKSKTVSFYFSTSIPYQRRLSGHQTVVLVL